MSKRKRDDEPAATKSVMQLEEGSFPRGGGSVLTPLEIRQATNEASKELFDNDKGKKRSKHLKKPTQKVTNKKTKTSAEMTETAEPKFHIESVNARLVKSHKGTTVLAQIIQINRTGLKVALPNNLIGEIPITYISKPVSAALPGQDDDDDSDSDSEEPVDPVELSHYKFTIGQWLRVSATDADSTASGIQLTCDPAVVNESISAEDMANGMLIQGYIQSIEDRGAIVDLGNNKSGFISKKELAACKLSIESLVVGQVRLFQVVSKGRVLNLTDAAGSTKKQVIESLDSMDSLVAGTLLEVLVTEVEDQGLMTKIFGHRDASLDALHAGFIFSDEKPSLGDKITARVIYSQGQLGFNVDETVEPIVMLSVLDNVVGLTTNSRDAFESGQKVDGAKVISIVPKIGAYVEVAGQRGFVHISRISDDHVDTVESIAPLGSVHLARVLDYSPIDNLYIMAFAPAIVNQKYASLSNIPIGEDFRGIITGNTKDGGFFVTLYNYEDDGSLTDVQRKQKLKEIAKGNNKGSIRLRGIAGPLHISDVMLKNPELKYPVDSTVKCRVLAVNDGGIRLTLKKSLVNFEDPVFQSWADVKPGARAPATIIKIRDNGAVVEFFGGFTGFLPVKEMSEAAVSHPSKLFRLGQTVRTTVLKVDDERERAVVTCRSSTVQSDSDVDDDLFNSLVEGKSVVTGKILEKTANGITLDLGENVKGTLARGHFSDDITAIKGISKTLKKGDNVKVVVLQKNNKRKLITVSAKQSLISEAQNGGLLSSFEDVLKISRGEKRCGYITNISDIGLFVGFANGVSGLVPKSQISDNDDKTTSSFTPFQSVQVAISKVDRDNKRFYLTMRQQREKVDGIDMPVPGDIAEVIITSVKANQINVKVGETKKQGRIDVSQIYDSIKSIKDIKKPLSAFKTGEKLKAKIIGFHDVRNHRFLPISHRSSGHVVFELSIKPSILKKKNDNKVPTPLSADNLEVGDKHLAFINNITADFVWVNITPNVKGKISLLDLSSDIAQISSEEAVEKNFPIGSAVSTVVKATEPALKFAVEGVDNTKTWENVKVGDVVPAIVLKVFPSNLIVKIGEDLNASAFITDLADKYTDNLPETFSDHSLVFAKVTEVDNSNKKVYVTLRKSELADKEVEAEDPVINEAKIGDVVRGFVKNVSDAGLFVSLSRTLLARVQIKNLSNDFLKDWKKYFTVNQLVRGKIIGLDARGRVELSLKKSDIDGVTASQLKSSSNGINEVQVGNAYDGTVRKVEEYGVFVKLDDFNVSGLCHRSELADIPLHNLSKVFSEGDRVKVKVLKVDLENRRLSLGMKASYFNEEDSEMEEQSDAENEDVEDSESDDEEVAMDIDEQSDEKSEGEDSSDEESTEESGGLSASFDWTASILDQMKEEDSESDSEDEDDQPRKKRRKGLMATEDKTASLSTKLPQSVSDFERLLMGSPNSSVVWMNYMAFQLQLSEVDKAREVGRRALKSIGVRYEDERLNIWVALLNLENSFGTKEELEETFAQSCQYMDSKTMHMKMATIYASSDKIDEAVEVYNKACKKFGRQDASLWASFGQMLYNNDRTEEARELLDRALKTVQQTTMVHQTQRELISKFAVMEYAKGNAERGRTLFEGLVSSYPRRIDIWNVYVDQEMKINDKDYLRRLFERLLSGVKLSQKQAKFFFKKWLSHEARFGDSKSQDYVKAKAAEYVNGGGQ